MLELEGFNRLLSRMKENTGMLLVSGCMDAQKAHLIACLSRDVPVRCIIAPDDLRAREIYENYQLFDPRVYLYPARDFVFAQADLMNRQLASERIAFLKALCEYRAGRDQNGEGITVILTAMALMSRCIPLEIWEDSARSYQTGDEIDFVEEKKALRDMGYERVEMVEGPGQFASRGGILDIFPLTEENPIRIELWGDEIDSIRTFDVESQRAIEGTSSVLIYPASEFTTNQEITEAGLCRIRKEAEKQEKRFRASALSEEAYKTSRIYEDAREKLEDFGDTSVMENFSSYFYEEGISLLDYFPSACPIFVDEPGHVAENAQAAEAEFADSISHRLEKGTALPGQGKTYFQAKAVFARLSRRSLVGLTTMGGGKCPFPIAEKMDIGAGGTGVYNGDFSQLVSDLRRYRKNGWRVILLTASRTRGKRLAQDLQDNEVPAFYSEDPDMTLKSGHVSVIQGNAHRGYEYPLLKFAVLTESDIFGQAARRQRRRRKLEGKNIQSFTELHPGDYVVHENHGIGIYRGVEQVTVDHVQKDYMKIEYASGSNLYVLATQLDMIQKYADADSGTPRLSRLGSTEWQRTKGKVRTAVEEVAEELVQLYAQRQQQRGYAFGPDTTWQTEFEEMFPYEETQDQLSAIEETKKDMESDRIMDRLICGDVGYGKTEIAIRAAFKAVQESKQVAFLVPTTILAQQHYNTFLQRMKDYPVRVDLMCRFRSRADQQRTVQGLKSGAVDIVIGTHRLLSKDIAFRDLGLLVVDEEQRFGVTHKEKIKQLKKNVDVLTLTATPIPRTLHMSLIGIRDMSVLEEAPQDRLPIQTYVMEFSEETIREAIARELARRGQVYVVYNHVATIPDMTRKIQNLVPSANIAYAHGQMEANQIEDIMYDFINGAIDVLVSTTIIETGLDIANVNTMIICDADRMGLSQLYQLRGRIGRSNRTAYAFLMYKKDKVLREVAEKRLAAIREYTELGSGFKIAMRDLEIRGAGNMLGKAQSGHIAEVGYDLYCKLLNECVMALKGESTESTEFDTSIDIDVNAYIPDSYISNENQKLDLYKRIACTCGEKDYEDLLDELMDRFGEPPKMVQDLLRVALLKYFAHACYLTELTEKDGEIRFKLYEKAPASAEQISSFMKGYGGRMRFVAQKKSYFAYQLPKKRGKQEDILTIVDALLKDMKERLYGEKSA